MTRRELIGDFFVRACSRPSSDLLGVHFCANGAMMGWEGGGVWNEMLPGWLWGESPWWMKSGGAKGLGLRDGNRDLRFLDRRMWLHPALSGKTRLFRG